jgi:hypothetical protein
MRCSSGRRRSASGWRLVRAPRGSQDGGVAGYAVDRHRSGDRCCDGTRAYAIHGRVGLSREDLGPNSVCCRGGSAKRSGLVRVVPSGTAGLAGRSDRFAAHERWRSYYEGTVDYEKIAPVAVQAMKPQALTVFSLSVHSFPTCIGTGLSIPPGRARGQWQIQAAHRDRDHAREYVLSRRRVSPKVLTEARLSSRHFLNGNSRRKARTGFADLAQRPPPDTRRLCILS